MKIWEFATYREYLGEKLGGAGTRNGERKRLAEAIGVHTTFVSQVFSGKADFSLEQAEAINQFFSHTEDEGEFFLLLVLHDRSGTRSLKARFKQQLENIRKKRLSIADRVKGEKEITAEDRETFYSSYLYGAVHVLSSVPGCKQVESLAQILQMPRDQAQRIVDFLLGIGVLVEKNQELGPGPRHVHLGTKSETLLKHHANWRLHSLTKLHQLSPEDVRYSGCVSLSVEDAFRIKESLLENLEGHLKRISASPEETAYVYNLDFYKFAPQLK